ncbi:tetratricopeptide repeat protein [mine drainage metagenome]|uniref:Tetratricopeptide repeat protein n=1 Tax=mine drainage metagenome TaxID=410659 RepID=A0A1J5RH45_9ZZZZ
MSRRPFPLAAACLAACLLPAAAGAAQPGAADPALTASIVQIEHQWAHITYEVKDGDAQYAQYKALAAQASALAARYPQNAEPLVWQGVVTSTEAGVAGSFSALGLAKEARDLFQKAGRIDMRALHGAIPTSLGSLYYLVPGFPLGFGDDDKARQYLQQGLAMDPNGLDSNYFYGDFLYRQEDYAQARAVLSHALRAPVTADRPVWDAGRRRQIRDLLAKVNSKLAS